MVVVEEVEEEMVLVEQVVFGLLLVVVMVVLVVTMEEVEELEDMVELVVKVVLVQFILNGVLATVFSHDK